MGSILAIESDPKRRRLLTTLIREYVKGDITIVESVKAAIASLADHVPDLIVAPTLLSPQIARS
jgi:CheY-like chemotaxis protein